MIQKNFFLKTPVTVGVALVEIKNILKSVPHKGALLTIYETGFPKLQIRIRHGAQGNYIGYHVS